MKNKRFLFLEDVHYCLTFFVFLVIWLYSFIFIENKVFDIENRRECLIAE